jgi:hypothetical protein
MVSEFNSLQHFVERLESEVLLRGFKDTDESRFAITNEKRNETVCGGSLLHDRDGVGLSVYLGDPFDAGWLAGQEKAVARGKEAQLP